MTKPVYLFLCHGGAKRSPTAAAVAREIAKSRGLDIEIEYGSSDAIELNRPNTEYQARILESKTRIAVMELDQVQKLKRMNLTPGKIYCLDIPDIYEKDDPALRKILESKIETFISDTSL